MGLSRPQLKIIFSIIALFVVGTFASDAYVPSLPAMAIALNASHESVKMTIAVYLLGFGISPLLFGPLSDHYGRKVTLLSGLCIALLGSLVCVVANNIHMVMLGRFIQGFGIASGMSIARTVLRDVFSGKDLSRVSAIIGMIMGAIPGTAPIVGGYVQAYWGWRGNFILLLMLIVLVFLWQWLQLPETNTQRYQTELRLKATLHHYAAFLRNKDFIIFPICAGLGFSGLMAYIAITPFLYQDVIGISPVANGWLALISGAAIFIGSLLNSRLLKYFEAETILIIAAGFMIVGALGMLVPGLLGVTNVSVIVIPFAFYVIGLALTFSNAFTAAVMPLTSRVGMASALYSTIQMIGCASSNSLAALVHVRSQIPLALILLGLSAVFGLLMTLRMLQRANYAGQMAESG